MLPRQVRRDPRGLAVASGAINGGQHVQLEIPTTRPAAVSREGPRRLAGDPHEDNPPVTETRVGQPVDVRRTPAGARRPPVIHCPLSRALSPDSGFTH